MSIIYNDLNNDFTLIPNEILQDARVSGLAFKLYSYIAFRLGRSKEWEFYNREIISHFKEGRDAVMKAKNELLDLGYLEIVKQNKSASGKFLGNDYIIRKSPKKPHTENPLTESPLTESPLTENQYTNNNDINKKDINKKDCIARQSNFSQNETLVLTQENFKMKWLELGKENPKAGFEAKYETFKQNWLAKSRGKNKSEYKDWEAYFKEDWSTHEYNLDPALNPLKIAEQEKIEAEKRREESEDESKKIAEYFDKSEGIYDKGLTDYVKKAIKLTAGESVFAKYFEDVYCAKSGKEGILVSTKAKAFAISYNHSLKVDAIFNENRLKGMLENGEDRELVGQLLKDLTSLNFRPTKWSFKTLEDFRGLYTGMKFTRA